MSGKDKSGKTPASMTSAPTQNLSGIVGIHNNNYSNASANQRTRNALRFSGKRHTFNPQFEIGFEGKGLQQWEQKTAPYAAAIAANREKALQSLEENTMRIIEAQQAQQKKKRSSRRSTHKLRRNRRTTRKA